MYDLKGDFAASLQMFTRALQLTCSQLNPQGASIVSALANVGHLQNVLGHHAEALPILRKAREIADRMPETRESVKAFVLTNLGTACRGIGELDESEECFHKAITCAEGPLGQRELGRVYYDLARLYVTEADYDRAGEYYARSVEAYGQWKPVASPEFLRVFQDYAYYLRSVDQSDEADATKKRAAQMQQTLRDINHMHQGEVKKISASVVQSVAKTAKPARFPIFWTIFFIYQFMAVWDGGVRVAPYRSWMLLITCIAVLSLKLKNKYSPPSREELSQGAAVALMSMIPFARSVLPELSQLSKKGIAIFVVIVLGLLAGAKAISVPPNTVPAGLLPIEYAKLGQNLAKQESFTLARQALDKAIELDPNGNAGNLAKRLENCQLPKNLQPDAAIQANMSAKQEEHENKEASVKAWQDCVSKYPDFEFPYIHLAQTYLGDKKDKSKVQDAEAMLNKVLAQNPNCFEALIAMSRVKNEQDDFHGGLAYTKKALNLLSDKSDPSAKFSEDMLDSLDKKIEEKKAAKHAIKSSPSPQ